MDAIMPGLDGFETTRLMKMNGITATIPVVFMTGLTETEHVVRGLECGGVDYVAKPVAPDEVVARVTVHLATARLTRSARMALDTTGRYPHSSPHFASAISPRNSPLSASISANRCISGSSLCSGMFGINS